MTGDQLLRELDDMYGKLLAFVMYKHNLPHIVLNPSEIVAPPEGLNIVVQELEDGLHIRIVSDEEGRRLQAMENKFNPPKRS